MTPQKWIESTGAIGIVSKSGRYGGTYAHKEIAFEFASWISVEFKLYLVQEFERLKTEEMKQFGWDIKQNLAKINYRIHTDAIKEHLIPQALSAKQISNLENLNAVFINKGMSQSERFAKLKAIAISQMEILTQDHRLERFEEGATQKQLDGSFVSADDFTSKK